MTQPYSLSIKHRAGQQIVGVIGNYGREFIIATSIMADLIISLSHHTIFI
jgi:hypothetical protein